MRGLSRDIEQQITNVYRRMALEGRYRPAAPSDGMGNITVPLEELDLDAEAKQYAAQWWEQEESDTFFLGCANYPDRPVMVLALEAARLCCAGGDGATVARRLLQIAIDELDQ